MHYFNNCSITPNSKKKCAWKDQSDYTQEVAFNGAKKSKLFALEYKNWS